MRLRKGGNEGRLEVDLRDFVVDCGDFGGFLFLRAYGSGFGYFGGFLVYDEIGWVKR